MLYSHTNTLTTLSFTTAARMTSWCQSVTEVIWFGTQSKMAKVNNSECSLRVRVSNIQPSTVVCNLGLHLYNQLSMKQHEVKVAATCPYHLHRLRQIRRRVDREVTIRLVLCIGHVKDRLL